MEPYHKSTYHSSREDIARRYTYICHIYARHSYYIVLQYFDLFCDGAHVDTGLGAKTECSEDIRAA